MKTFLALLKVQWRTRASAFRSRTSASRIGTTVMAIVGQAVILFFLFSTAWALYQQLAPSGQADLIPAFGVLFGVFLVLLLSGLSFFSSFFDNHDAELLLSLPLPPLQILAAKWLAQFPAAYGILLVSAGPFWLVYGLQQGTPFFWLMLPPVLLLLPWIPLALAAVAVLLVGFLTAGRVRTDWLRAILGVLLFGTLMGVQVLSMHHPVAGSPYASAVLAQRTNLANLVSTLWPIRSAVQALLAPTSVGALLGWTSLLGQSAIALALAALLGRFTFLRAWSGDVGGGAVAPAPPVVAPSRRKNRIAVRSPSRALWWREWILVARTPSLFTQIAMFNLLMPLSILLPALLSPHRPLAHPPAVMQSWIVFGLLTYLLFLGSLNLLAISSISREGRWFWISQLLPVSPALQIRIKTIVAGLGGVVPLLLVAILGSLALHLDPLHTVLFLLLGLAAILMTGLLGVLSDLAAPRLDWTDPGQALRGGSRAVQNLILSFGSLLVMGAVAAVSVGLHLPVDTVLWVLLLVLGIADWQLLRVLEGYGARRYQEIEM